jgi:hypothetical protein
VDMSYRALNGFIDSGKSILDLNGFINLQFDCGKTKQLSQKRQVQKISRVLKACEKTKEFFQFFEKLQSNSYRLCNTTGIRLFAEC